MSDLDQQFGDTTLTVSDLALVGAGLLNYAAAASLMRHERPQGTSGYVRLTEDDSVHVHIVNDFVLWCDGNDPARDRLLRFIEESGWSPVAYSDADEDEMVA